MTQAMTVQPGDIIQNGSGYFYRVTTDGTFADLSDPDRKFVHDSPVVVAAVADPVVLIRDGAATGNGSALAVRMASLLSRIR